MLTCTRRLTFCAGHRVLGHEGKCAHLHGHNYVVEVTAYAMLDSIGRVIDFSVLKGKIGGWIDENWDHGFVYFREDGQLGSLFGFVRENTPDGWVDTPGALHGSKSFACPFNPTAENLATYLLRIVCPEVLKLTGVEVTHVRVWETENCWADADLSDRLKGLL